MAMVSEDFSFPKITYPLPNFESSPSLWRVSSLVYPDYRDEGEERDRIGFSSRKSISNLENDYQVKRELCEEKMDMLWEDFNEELQRVSNSSMEEKKKMVKVSSTASYSDSVSSEKMVELCCVQALKMSRTGSGMMYDKRPSNSNSIVVMMKVLKKFFLLKTSAGIIKKK